MKSPLSIVLFIALSAGVASAGKPVIDDPTPTNLPDNGDCSSADGAIEFSSFRYSGGAAPPPGLLVSAQTMVVNGVEWGSTRHFEPGTEVQDEEHWPIVVELADASLVSSEGGPMAGHVVFTVKMTVSHLTADVAPETRYVICENSWSFAP